LVAYNDPNDPEQWAHSYVEPGFRTPHTIDIDGVKCAEPGVSLTFSSFTSSSRHQGWWKLQNLSSPHVYNGKDGLVMLTNGAGSIVDPVKKEDKDFDWPGPGGSTIPLACVRLSQK